MTALAAPQIVRSEADVKADRQEVVMMPNDFWFKTPEEVLAEISCGTMDGMGAMYGMDMGNMGATSDMSGIKGMSGMAMDLYDYDFDAQPPTPTSGAEHENAR